MPFTLCAGVCVCVTDLHLRGGVVKKVSVVCLSSDEPVAGASSNTASSTWGRVVGGAWWGGWGGGGRAYLVSASVMPLTPRSSAGTGSWCQHHRPAPYTDRNQ